MSSKSKAKTKSEKYPLPATVDGICSLIREILGPGHVQHIELDVNGPVRVIRDLEEGSAEMEEEAVDLDGSLRNMDIIEYSSEGASPFQVVIDMMQLMSAERLTPVCWVTGEGNGRTLSDWLEFRSRGMPSNVEYLMGLPVHKLKSLSEDTLLLCGSQYPNADFDELNLAVKTAIELRRPNHDVERPTPSSKIDGPVGNDSPRSNPPANQLAAATRGLRKIDWKPTHNS